jgi:hypothetical protein
VQLGVVRVEVVEQPLHRAGDAALYDHEPRQRGGG